MKQKTWKGRVKEKHLKKKILYMKKDGFLFLLFIFVYF